MDTDFDTAPSMMNMVGAALQSAESGQVVTVRSPATGSLATRIRALEPPAGSDLGPADRVQDN